MPYRRLPNTDTARIRAMKTALELGKELPPNKLAFSARSLVRLQKFLPQFEQAIMMQRQALSSQVRKSKSFGDSARKARIYLTHFIRVMNMAIFRGEIPVETRAFYGLATNDSTVPSLNSENELLSWGRRIIDGEEFRIRKGGSPITNPTIAVVKVRFEQFIDSLNLNTTLIKRTREYSLKTNELRNEADEIILTLWNEVENSLSGMEEQERRKKCEEYGLVYFFRKGEMEKIRTVSGEPAQTVHEVLAPAPGPSFLPARPMPEII